MTRQEAVPEGFSEEMSGDLLDKVKVFKELLEERGIPYAIGGAIALAYYRRPRGTSDIDLDIFLPPEERRRVVEALGSAFEMPNTTEFLEAVERDDQGHTFWDDTRVDVFFADTDFHLSMAERARTVPFIDDSKVRILSCEDLLVCKALFNRPEDWGDIDKMCAQMGPALDPAYLEKWLKYFLPEDEPRIARLLGMVEEHSA